MLYLMQRYFLGVSGLFYLVVGFMVFAPIAVPESVPNLVRTDTFLPLLDLFQISAAVAACMAILSVQPLVTDGAETKGMDTPFAHPGFHASMLLVVAALPMFLFAYQQPEMAWQAQRLANACLHVGSIATGAATMVCIGFYPLRWRAKLREQDARDRRLYGHIG